MSLPPTLDFVHVPGRSGQALQAYEPAEPAVVTYQANGARVRLATVLLWSDGDHSVDVIMQTRGKAPRDYKTGGRGTMPLASFLSLLHPADARVIRDAVAAAELDRRMREQMATDPEAGGPRDPELGPVGQRPDVAEHRVAYGHTGTVMHAATPGSSPSGETGTSCTTMCGRYGFLGSGWFQRALAFTHSAARACPECRAAVTATSAELLVPGAAAVRQGDRITFTLHRHGVQRLAEGLGCSEAEVAEAARRTGWVVES